MVKRYKKSDDVSYTLGVTLTLELLLTRIDLVKRIYFHSKYEDNESKELITKLCYDSKIEIIVSDKAFNILSDKENCFVIGEFLKFESHLDKEKNHILLVNPSNNGNLGTIIRSAVGFNIRNIAIVTPSVDIFNPQVIRGSMGSIFHLNFEYFSSYNEYRSIYDDKRYIYSFMLQGEIKLHEVKKKDRYTLIFGNEAKGLDDEYLELSTAIKIAHDATIDSLNLPVAVSIALYEFTKENY